MKMQQSYQITDTLSSENNYNISSYLSFDKITAQVNFEIIYSLFIWDMLWGAITSNWELLWGVILSHSLPSRGVLRHVKFEYHVMSNLCELMFVRCQECMQYLLRYENWISRDICLLLKTLIE
jgi:hypothetical protein